MEILNSKLLNVAIFIFIFVSVANPYPIKIIGHRGASSLAPENTMASFQKAIEVKADYFELDIFFSKDDSLMVIHDASVDRTSNGHGSIHDLTYFELKNLDFGFWFDKKFSQERIPTLYEALLLAKSGKIKVCIHVYETNTMVVEKIINLVKSMNMEDQIIVMSFDLNQVKQFKYIEKSIKVLFLVNELTPVAIELAYKNKIDYIGPNSISSKNLIDSIHVNNLKVFIWTVDNTDDMLKYFEFGVDGIITNYPQRLSQLLNNLTVQTEYSTPTKIKLFQNYPNPFNSSTLISYYIPFNAYCKLTLYDIFGREIREMEIGEARNGIYTINFSAKEISSGEYFYVLHLEDTVEHKLYSIAKKMIIMK